MLCTAPLFPPGSRGAAGVHSIGEMRALTIVNLVLWGALFLFWMPYTALVGWGDPASVEVRWILAVAAALQLVLFGLRIRRRRPVLG